MSIQMFQPMLTTDETISRTIKALMALDGTSVVQLSEGSGIPLHTMYRRLRSGEWRASEVADIAAYYGRPTGDLYEGVVGQINREPRAGIEPAAVRLQGHRLIPFGLRKVPGLSRIAA